MSRSKAPRRDCALAAQKDVSGVHMYIQIKEGLKICCFVKSVAEFFGTVLWFMIQELVPLDFVTERLMHFKSYFNEKPLMLILQTLGMWSDPACLRRTRAAMNGCFNHGNTQLFVDPEFRAPAPFQLYVMARFVLNEPGNVLSFVRCLALYASGMIKQATACGWIKRLDPVLARKFMECSSAVELHPSRILVMAAKCPWALGANVMGAMRRVPSMAKDTLLECALEAVKHVSEEKAFLVGLPETVCELQAVKAYHALKVCVHTIRSGELDFGQAKPIIVELVGSCDETVTPLLAHQYMSVLMQRAARSQQTYKRLLIARLKSLDINSVEWREAFCKLFRRQSIVRDLTLNFMSFQIPGRPILLKIHRFLTEFLSRFKDLSVLYAQFIKIFHGGKYYCACDGACALAYYFELLKFAANKRFTQDLAALLFEEQPPIKQLKGEALGHLDVLALNFAKALNRMDEDHFTPKISEIVTTYDDDFLFEVDVVPDRVVIHSFANPTAYTTVSK